MTASPISDATLRNALAYFGTDLTSHGATAFLAIEELLALRAGSQVAKADKVLVDDIIHIIDLSKRMLDVKRQPRALAEYVTTDENELLAACRAARQSAQITATEVRAAQEEIGQRAMQSFPSARRAAPRSPDPVAKADAALYDACRADLCGINSTLIMRKLEACRAARAAEGKPMDSEERAWVEKSRRTLKEWCKANPYGATADASGGENQPAPSPPEAQACAVPGHAEAVALAEAILDAYRARYVTPGVLDESQLAFDALVFGKSLSKELLSYRAARRPSEAGEALPIEEHFLMMEVRRALSGVRYEDAPERIAEAVGKLIGAYIRRASATGGEGGK